MPLMLGFLSSKPPTIHVGTKLLLDKSNYTEKPRSLLQSKIISLSTRCCKCIAMERTLRFFTRTKSSKRVVTFSASTRTATTHR
jgi:hypothetical protein